METLKIDKLNIGETKSGNTKGKDWTLYPVSIQSNGKWYNGAVFNKEDLEHIQDVGEGGSIDVIIYQEEYKGKTYNKFKLPKKSDITEHTIKQLEQRVKELEKFAKFYFKQNPEQVKEYKK